MKSGALNCLKYLVFFFNLLFFIAGVAALAIGIWAVVNQQSFKQILGDHSAIFNGVYVIIATGGALTLIGFLGCCGAIKENRCLLGTFFILLLIIFIAQLGGTIYIYVKRNEVFKDVEATIGKYGDGTAGGKRIKQGWDTVQTLLMCCGAKNYSEWKKNAAWETRNPGKIVPDSCCKHDKAMKKPLDATQCQAGADAYLNKQGCMSKLKSSMVITGIAAAVVLVIELLGMIFACCLYTHTNEYGELA